MGHMREWKLVEITAEFIGWKVVVDGPSPCDAVCDVPAAFFNAEQNAHLIAATPALLAACEALIAEDVIFCSPGRVVPSHISPGRVAHPSYISPTVYRCPFCRRTEPSPIDFRHNPTCPVIQARAAIAKTRKSE
jgi:hypothetical protein